MKYKILTKALILSTFVIVSTNFVNANDNVLLRETKKVNNMEQTSNLSTMEIIDLETLDKPMIIGAGSGPTTSLEWSTKKNKNFKISNNQQVEIQLMYIDAFKPNASSKNIVLTFTGDNGEVVTQKFMDTDTDTTKIISFKEAGIYELSIYNSQDFSINYGFKMK